MKTIVLLIILILVSIGSGYTYIASENMDTAFEFTKEYVAHHKCEVHPRGDGIYNYTCSNGYNFATPFLIELEFKLPEGHPEIPEGSKM